MPVLASGGLLVFVGCVGKLSAVSFRNASLALVY